MLFTVKPGREGEGELVEDYPEVDDAPLDRSALGHGERVEPRNLKGNKTYYGFNSNIFFVRFGQSIIKLII